MRERRSRSELQGLFPLAYEAQEVSTSRPRPSRCTVPEGFCGEGGAVLDGTRRGAARPGGEGTETRTSGSRWARGGGERRGYGGRGCDRRSRGAADGRGLGSRSARSSEARIRNAGRSTEGVGARAGGRGAPRREGHLAAGSQAVRVFSGPGSRSGEDEGSAGSRGADGEYGVVYWCLTSRGPDSRSPNYFPKKTYKSIINLY